MVFSLFFKSRLTDPELAFFPLGLFLGFARLLIFCSFIGVVEVKLRNIDTTPYRGKNVEADLYIRGFIKSTVYIRPCFD